MPPPPEPPVHRLLINLSGDDGASPLTSMGQVPMDRIRSVFDGMFDGVWLVDVDHRTTYANAAMARLLATTREDLLGRPMTDFLDDAVTGTAMRFLDRQPHQVGERVELRFRCADGTELFGLVAGSPIATADGSFVGTMLNVSDMTGKRSLDAQLVQNQRLEAIGQFAGGIAHDFNNLLTAIHGYAELAHLALAPGDPARDDIRQVLASAAKATGIVRTLLAFSRRQILVPVDIDPGEILIGLVPILRPLFGDDVRLELDVAREHSWVRVDPTQLEQVVVNLAVNARDAMAEGGTVSIAVHDLDPPDPDRPDADRTAGPFVRISVRDTGCGMDEATQSRMFDPFFTTKETSKGTGLGLSTVFGIVAQSGGQVQVESSPGLGTTFFVDLPMVRPGARNKLEAPPALEAHASSGVVLVAEDDAAIRQFACRILESAGHTVLEAADGDQALLESRRSKAEIDVLVTDIVMPGMHGRELAAAIRASRPDIGIVFMSGYADAGRDGDAGLGAEGLFLPKPFTVAALRDIVATAGANRAARVLDAHYATDATADRLGGIAPR